MNVVLMADVVGSSSKAAKQLMSDFKESIKWMNKLHRKDIQSPLTITLGDEFQGVVKSPSVAIQIMIALEEHLMTLKKPFKLRYVIYEGKIDTETNKMRAYEMLGPALTNARATLNDMKSTKNRFSVHLLNTGIAHQLNLSLFVLQGIIDRWNPTQQKLAMGFLKSDYRELAKRLKKDPSSMWRRRKSLMMEEYESLKKLIQSTI